jgi:Anthrone oxygenase
MRSFLEFVAALSSALFAGAAIYINLVEHLARMDCDTKTGAMVWAPSYQRATLMQASLAILSCLAGVGAWGTGGGILWLVAALLIGAVVPFTLIAIKPTNHQLLALDRDLASSETRALLQKWGRLHAVRSALSLAASVLYFGLLIGP